MPTPRSRTLSRANGPVVWFGPRFLGVSDGNCFKNYVFRLQDGSYQRECKTSGGVAGLFARTPPDDRIWCVTRGGFNQPSYLVAVDVPENDITQNPSPEQRRITNNQPVWSFEQNGILRLPAGR